MSLSNHKIGISVFSPFINKEGVKVPGVLAKSADLYTELYRFKEGYYIMVIEELRRLTDKDEINQFKLQNLPAFTFSCKFKDKDYRKQINISQFTNLLCIDIDSVGVEAHIEKQKLLKPNYGIQALRDEIFENFPCVYAGLSCSGRGVFFIVKYEDGKHLECFHDIEDYFITKHNITIDASCKDYARLRFATYDPHSHIGRWEDVEPYKIRDEYKEKLKKIEEQKKEEKKVLIVKHTTDAAGAIMETANNMIRNARVGERHNKIRAAARLVGGYVGSNLISEVYAKDVLMKTAFDSDYDDMVDAEKTIDFGISSGKLYPIDVNIITPEDPNFSYFVEQEESRQREIRNMYLEIRELNRKGIELHLINFTDIAGRYYVDVQRVVNVCERLYKQFVREFGINNKPLICKVEAYLDEKYDFRRDIIAESTQYKLKISNDWIPLRVEDLWREIVSVGFKFKFEDLVRLLRSNYVPEINVWEDFFKNIPYNDNGFDHIDFLASHIICKNKTEQSFFQTMFKKMLVRTMMCALDDNYANRMVFVLASETQSNGKSTFIRWLNPFGAHEFYAENPLEDNKDSRIRLSDTFIYNLEELSTIGRLEINRLKAVISQIGTKDRKPYARSAENMVRRCSFFGSTNRTTFLTDDRNTRWLCFEIKEINWVYQEVVDKMQLWAQVYHLYKQGYHAELTVQEAKMRDAKNQDFEVTTVESDLLKKYFEPSTENDPSSVFMTCTSIHEHLLIMTKESRIQISNIWVGRALSKHNFVKMRRNNVNGYYVKPLNLPAYMNVQGDGRPAIPDEDEDIDIPF